MGKKRQVYSDNIFFDILAIILIATLVIFKAIGDSVIALGRLFILSGLKTYNLFLTTLHLSRTLQKQTFNLFSNLSHKIKSPLKKRKTIFQTKPIWQEAIKRLPRPSISWPRPRFFFPKFQLPTVKIKYFFLGSLFTAILTVGYQLYVVTVSIPNPVYLTFRDVPTTTKIYDRNGKLLYEIYAEENRTPVKLSEVPEVVKQATVAIEDKEFFIHKGFSLRGITRAILHNFTSDSLEGGSTITQQLIRSVLLTPEKTLIRKIKELALSVWAEQIYSKEQILEMYLNQVPYGGTAWGIEAAAQTYFGKSIKEVSLAETALLAGLPAAPSRFSPFGAHPELAKKRQAEVLTNMVVGGYITRDQAEQAKAEALKFRTPKTTILAPHFVMYVKDLLEQQYGLRMIEKGGLRVTTTLDLSLQEMAQKTVTSQVENLHSLSVSNGAALITNPQTGEILTMVGAIDYFDKERQGNVNVVTSPRQPGSAIKVVNYAAALAHGFTTTTILDDSPTTYKAPGQPSYSPVNYDGRFHGRIPLRIALASSYNVPAVKTLSQIGIKTMIDQGKLMGITSWEDESRFGLSLTLGGGEVTMLDMAKVYGTLAAGGIRKNLTPFIKIINYKGETLPLPAVKNKAEATSPGIAFILSSILADNAARTPAFGPNSALVVPGKTVAVKTGTSDNKRDNWTIGYTADYVVVVWVGNNDNSPMHPYLTSGVTGAAPIWNEIMRKLLANKSDKPSLPPNDVISIICYGKKEYFIRGTEPKGGCPALPTSPVSPTGQ